MHQRIASLPPNLTRRNIIFGAALLLSLAALAAELSALLPYVLQVWQSYDYGLYIEMGRAAREGINPVGPRHYYPLPTVLWIFAPLSMLPNWFRLVWIMVPMISILYLFRREGLWLFLFTPLWFATTDAMLDGWLLVPLAWLLRNRPLLAGIGAVALLAKPQLAMLTVGYMLLHWLWSRDWKNLASFSVGLFMFCLPAFIFDPQWVTRLIEVLPQRANESTGVLPLLTSSVWAWWYADGLARIVFAVLIATSAFLFYRAARTSRPRASAIQALNQLFVPVLFASNLVTLIPTLRGRNEILSVVACSLCAFALDHALGGFGGGYALIAVAVLYFRSRAAAPDAIIETPVNATVQNSTLIPL